MKRFSVLLFAALLAVVMAAPPARAGETDPAKKRVPADQLAAAKALKNPVPTTPETIAKGKALYSGKGVCFTCHGPEGKGDGILGQALNPNPRNFHNATFWKNRTDGELMWVLKNGSPGTQMVASVPGMITEEEGWQIIAYLRTLKGK